MSSMTMVQAINQSLRIALATDESVLLLGQDIGKNGGVFRATEGLWEQWGDQRVIDTPLSEAGMIGTSVGLSLQGWKPIVEIQFMGFIYPAFEQIVSHLARFRTRTQGGRPMSVVIRCPVGGGVRAPELHSESTESLFAHIPGLKIAIPSSPIDAKGLLLTAIHDPDPVLFLEPIKMYRFLKEKVPIQPYQIPLGKARISQVGEDVTLITWGAMTSVALSTAQLAKKEQIACEVIDLRSLSPLDTETIFRSVKKTGRVVIVHEAPKTGGFGAEIATKIQEACFYSLQAPIQRITGLDVPVPMSALEDYFLPNEERILAAIHAVLER